jgi:hypothetical protein
MSLIYYVAGVRFRDQLSQFAHNGGVCLDHDSLKVLFLSNPIMQRIHMEVIRFCLKATVQRVIISSDWVIEYWEHRRALHEPEKVLKDNRIGIHKI